MLNLKIFKLRTAEIGGDYSVAETELASRLTQSSQFSTEFDSRNSSRITQSDSPSLVSQSEQSIDSQSDHLNDSQSESEYEEITVSVSETETDSEYEAERNSLGRIATRISEEFDLSFSESEN